MRRFFLIIGTALGAVAVARLLKARRRKNTESTGVSAEPPQQSVLSEGANFAPAVPDKFPLSNPSPELLQTEKTTDHFLEEPASTVKEEAQNTLSFHVTVTPVLADTGLQGETSILIVDSRETTEASPVTASEELRTPEEAAPKESSESTFSISPPQSDPVKVGSRNGDVPEGDIAEQGSDVDREIGSADGIVPESLVSVATQSVPSQETVHELISSEVIRAVQPFSSVWILAATEEVDITPRRRRRGACDICDTCFEPLILRRSEEGSPLFKPRAGSSATRTVS